MHILNKYCEHIFVITIDRYNRKEEMIKRLDGINFEFYQGVDGSLITDEFYDKYLEKRLAGSLLLRKGALACSLSHINLYKKIYDEKLTNVLILEDDAILTQNIDKLEDYFNQLPSSYNIVYFGMNNCNVQYDYVIRPNINRNIFKLNNQIFRLSPYHFLEGTSSFFIKDYEILKDLIEFQSKWLYSADGGMMEYMKQCDKEYYAFLPQLIKTNDNNFSIIRKIDTDK